MDPIQLGIHSLVVERTRQLDQEHMPYTVRSEHLNQLSSTIRTTTHTMNTTQACTYLSPEYDARSSRISPAPYCGCKDLRENSSFCNTHYPIVYNEGTANRKRHADIRRAHYIQDISSLFNDVVAELELAGELEL